MSFQRPGPRRIRADEEAPRDESGSLAALERKRPGPTLKGRALRLLAQREHSRLELSRKIAPLADSPESLERALDELERDGWLSPERFAASLARRRAERFGLRRIEHELGTHRLDAAVSAPVIQSLRETERERACAAWRKRFGAPAADVGERARQHRFLAQRGFTGDAIAWALRHGAGDDASAPDPSDDPSD
ncbi:MAG: recombination regulator RecX [Burkholderiaceae bacterium]